MPLTDILLTLRSKLDSLPRAESLPESISIRVYAEGLTQVIDEAIRLKRENCRLQVEILALELEKLKCSCNLQLSEGEPDQLQGSSPTRLTNH